MYGDGIGSLTVNYTTPDSNQALWRIEKEDGYWLMGWLELERIANEEQFDVRMCMYTVLPRL